MLIRPAVEADVLAIEALMAPEIATGALLPRAVDAADFLVAERDGVVVGAVGLKPWAAGVVELGSLVAGERGVGLGAALVAAAVAEAGARGYHTVVALTGLEGFFERHGFRAVGAAPWALARGAYALPTTPTLDQAVRHKASLCAACPRLGACAQALLVRAVPVEIRIAA